MIFQRLRAPGGTLSLSIRPRSGPICAESQSCSQTPSLYSNRSPFQIPVRHASHGAAGRANGPKDGAGRRLGAKKTGDEYVIPGNIIFRQRGTNWHAGHNCGRGRDHTIYATEEGYVKYYRDPKLHPKRRYIGVVFDRTETLPLNPSQPRRRRLNMVAVPRASDDTLIATPSDIGIVPNPTDPTGMSVSVAQTPADAAPQMTKSQLREARRKMRSGRQPAEELSIGPNYSYRESNWSIGRAAERAGVQVKLFKPRDRFLAWQKTAVRRQRRAMKMQVGRKKGSSRKGSAKK